MTRRFRAALAGGLTCVVILLVATAAHSATIFVNTTEDELDSDGDCSLREAIRAANLDAAVDACVAGTGFDSIVVPEGLYVLSLVGTDEGQGLTGDLDITDSDGIEITGAGAGLTILDGNATDRVLEVTAGDFFLSDVTVRNGYVTGAGSVTGGGVRASSHNHHLSFTSVWFEDNTAEAGSTGRSGALGAGNGVYLITGCTFLRNHAIGGTGNGIGGALSATGAGSTTPGFDSVVTIRRSLFADNSATSTGNATSAGGALHGQAPLVLINTTVTGNMAGGTDGRGGGVSMSTSVLNAISSSTIASNTANTGGGIWAPYGAVGTGPYLASTIIGQNASTSTGPDVYGRFQSRGHLLIEDAGAVALDVTSAGNTATGNLLGVAPELETLQANGGPNATMALGPTSPAREAGSCFDAFGAPVATDQRGAPRPQLGLCDIGAFEPAPGSVGLVGVSSEAPGANCAAGGQRVDVGIDWNASGALEAAEVTTSSYVCDGTNGTNGSNGTNGTNGTDGFSGLIATSVEPAGVNCSAGGQRIDTGLDDGDGGGSAGNHILEPGEIDGTAYVCNGAVGATGANGSDGADGVSALLDVSVESAGSNCTHGGQRIDIGLDNGDGGGIAGNQLLEPGEIDQTQYVCAGANGTNGADGADGHATLAVTVTLNVGDTNCPHGGSELRIGLDNGDGGGTPNNFALESGEVDQSVFVCNGGDGENGALVALTDEPAGVNCPEGGQRMDAGIDNGDGGGTPSNGVLEAGEVDQVAYVCDGTAGVGALLVLTTLPVGDGNCGAGGTQLDIGLDNGDGGGTADDGVLQSGEVDQTSYVCNAVDGSDGTDGADGVNGANGADGADGSQGDDGADGAPALIAQTPLPAGSAACPTGGVVMNAGLDDGSGDGTALNGSLEPGEITESVTICNGTNGEPGAGCSVGGGPRGPLSGGALAWLLAAAAARRRRSRAR